MYKKGVFALLVLAAGALFAEVPYPMPEGAAPYWEYLGQTPLTPGRGFVGRLELGDPVSDMYSAIGGGEERMDYPFWYFFEDGPYALVIIARYDAGSMTFPIVGLALSGLADSPPPKLSTSEGVGFGSPWPEVVRAYGRPPLGVRAAGAEYPELGLTLYLDIRYDVSTILVHEPEPAPALLGTRYVNAGVELPQVVRPAEGILAVGLPEGWSLTEEADVTAFYEDPDGTWSVQVSTCVDCSDDVAQWAYMQETVLYGPNILAEEEWFLHPEALAAYGADESYCAEYEGGYFGHSWSLFLRRYTETVNVTVNCLELERYSSAPAGAARLAHAVLAALAFTDPAAGGP